MRVVTYAARGLRRSMAGSTISCAWPSGGFVSGRKDVIFLVVGSDQIYYGGDVRFTEGKTFREWVLSQDD